MIIAIAILHAIQIVFWTGAAFLVWAVLRILQADDANQHCDCQCDRKDPNR